MEADGRVAAPARLCKETDLGFRLGVILHTLLTQLPYRCMKKCQHQNSCFPKKPKEKGTTASLGLANYLGNLTPFSYINAHVLMNIHFGIIRAVENNRWADFTVANE